MPIISIPILSHWIRNVKLSNQPNSRIVNRPTKSDYIIGLLLYIFIFLTCAFTVLILLTESQLKFQWDRAGVDYLFGLYSIPIKMGVATFAIYATKLTLQRMAQTNHQIKETEVNNLFNNYYQHLGEFINLFKGHKLFLTQSKSSETKLLLTSLYKHYFSSSFDDFSYLIEKETRLKILEFQRKVESSSLTCSPINVWDIDISELTELMKYIDTELARVVNVLVLKYTDESSERTRIDSSGPNLDKKSFYVVNTVCLSYMFYSSLLVFEGVNNSVNPSIGFFYDEYMNGIFALIPQTL